ncbi:MAG: MFS transporter, partial [Aggregatilineales bacterium]
MTTTLNNKKNTQASLYRKRIRAWTLYDWANSAFATTILAALLPVYYSDVAGATLPTAATATAYWGLTGSFSLIIVALLSPILGTISDVMRGKKKFLSVFIMIGVIGTGLLVFVNTGDWFMASIFFVIGRVGFAGANVFYDSLLPHIAKEEDQDSVSTRGYALGYLGGGILLAINVVMFLFIPDSLFENAGVRLSFLTVAIWWALFSIPILRTVPEPPSATEALKDSETVISVSFKRIGNLLSDLRQYSELFKFLIAFLIYNDAINTIITLAAIYGAELGFGLVELVLALLLVQFVGIPFSLIFGRLPALSGDTRRHFYLAFICFNLVMLPTAGVLGSRLLPENLSGQRPPAYEAIDDFQGEGIYPTIDNLIDGWESVIVTGEEQAGEGFLASLAGIPDDVTYIRSTEATSEYEFSLNGQRVELTYDIAPDRGILEILLNGNPLTEITEDDDGNEIETPILVDMYSDTVRYNVTKTIDTGEPGQHTLTLRIAEDSNPDSTGNIAAITQLIVLQPLRQSNLPAILGLLAGLEVIGIGFAIVFGRFFKGLASTLDTRKSILLAL